MAETTSLRLFELAAALAEHSYRRRVVTDALNFPTGLYVLQGQIRLLGEPHQLVQVPSPDG